MWEAAAQKVLCGCFYGLQGSAWTFFLLHAPFIEMSVASSSTLKMLNDTMEQHVTVALEALLRRRTTCVCWLTGWRGTRINLKEVRFIKHNM